MTVPSGSLGVPQGANRDYTHSENINPLLRTTNVQGLGASLVAYFSRT